MEAERFSKTSTNFYQRTQYYIPDDTTLQAQYIIEGRGVMAESLWPNPYPYIQYSSILLFINSSKILLICYIFCEL
jgi:hypothetical protein